MNYTPALFLAFLALSACGATSRTTSAGDQNGSAVGSESAKNPNKDLTGIAAPEFRSLINLNRLEKDQITGDILYVDAFDADKLCENKGQRLPTPEELARFAEGRGAHGVVSEKVFRAYESQPNLYDYQGRRKDSRRPHEINYVPRDSTAETVTSLYYYSHGFYHSKEEDGAYGLWSSGRTRLTSYDRGPFSTFKLGKDGSINAFPVNYKAGVRCVDKN